MELVARMVDITTLPVDAIVSAANEMLAPGGGAFGAIHAKVGPELAAACATLGGCPTGRARITPGFRLPAQHVIHAVGPWQRSRWPWAGFEGFLDVPLRDIRQQFGIMVASGRVARHDRREGASEGSQ